MPREDRLVGTADNTDGAGGTAAVGVPIDALGTVYGTDGTRTAAPVTYRAAAGATAAGSGGVALPVPPVGGAGPGLVVGPAAGTVQAVTAHQERTVGALLGGVAGDVEELSVEGVADQLYVDVARLGGAGVGIVVVGAVDPRPGVAHGARLPARAPLGPGFRESVG